MEYKAVNCTWSQNVINNWLPFLVDNDCVASNIKGNVTEPNTKINGISITNVRTDGEYKVVRSGAMEMGSGASSCRYTLSSTSSIGENAIQYTGANGTIINTIAGSFRFDTIGEKQIQVLALVTPSGQCVAYGNDTTSTKWSVHFFPDSKNTIVSQSTTLTAKTANKLVSTFDGSAGVSIVTLTEDYAGALTCTFSSTGVYTCLINTPLADLPAIDCDPINGSNKNCLVTSITTTSFSVLINNNNDNAAINNDFKVTLDKQGADVNKDATIIGKFEQIRSDDLVKMRYTTDSALFFAANTPATIKYEDLENDNFNIYNITTGIATIPHIGYYDVSCLARSISAAGTNQIAGETRVYINGVERASVGIAGTGVSSTINPLVTTDGILLNATDTVECKWFSQVSIALTGAANTNIMTITEQPDFKSTVANLIQGQTTKCQTKYLNANVTSNLTWISDLGFSNLKIGRYYTLFFQTQAVTDQLTALAVDIFNDTNALNNQVAKMFHSTNTGTNIKNTIGNSYLFKSVNSGLSFTTQRQVQTKD